MYVCGNKSSKQWIGSIIYSALSIHTNRLNIHLFHYFIIIVIIFRSCSAFHLLFIFRCFFLSFALLALSLSLGYRLDHSWEILADPVLMNRYRISTNVQPHATEQTKTHKHTPIDRNMRENDDNRKTNCLWLRNKICFYI